MCTSQGPFFVFPDGTPLTKARFSESVKAALEELGLPQEQFVGHSFQDRSCHNCGTIWPGGLNDHDVRQVEQRSIPLVPQDTKRQSSISNCSSISETYSAVVDNGIAISLLSCVYSHSFEWV